MMPAASRDDDDPGDPAPRRSPTAGGVAGCGAPAEVRYFVPEPAILLIGCAPFAPPDLPPRRPGDGSEFRPAAPRNPCHVCGGVVRDYRCRVGVDPDDPAAAPADPPSVVQCGRCCRMDPAWDGHLRRQRDEGRARADADAAAAADDRWLDLAATEAAAADLVLDEVDRRRIWLGHRSPFGPPDDAVLRAATGQAFLRAIGQEPDWTLIRDPFGVVVGRQAADASRPPDEFKPADGAIDPGADVVWNGFWLQPGEAARPPADRRPWRRAGARGRPRP